MRALALVFVVSSTASASSIDHELIAQAIRRQLAPVRLCYERALASNPKLSGRVSLQIQLVAGRVQTVVVQQSTFPATSSVPACVAKAASGWQLPSDPRPIVFTYPFALKVDGSNDPDTQPSVTSGLSVEQVARVLERHVGAARVCGGSPGPSEILVSPEGKAEIAGGTSCLRNAIGGWTFPASSAPTRFVHVFR